MKRFAALAISVPLLLGQAPRDLAVTAVRHWSLSEVTRVAIEMSGEFQFRSDRLHNPERVYFDILNSRPRIASRPGYSETLEDRRVKRIRVAETVPGVTRVVLDLAEGVAVSSSQLSNPQRLVVEVRSTAAPNADAPQPAHTAPPVVTPLPATAPVVTAPLVKPPANPEPPKMEPPAASKPAGGLAASDRAGAAPPKTGLSKGDAPAKPKAESAKSGSAEPLGATPEAVAAAKHTSSGENSLVRALGLKLSRVVIDPGHGGHDQGTEGPHGLLEKDLVLDVAQRLGALIEDRLGAEVIYTRTDDTFIPLEGRTALANEKKADLFLSVHANSSPLPHIAGVETFYLNISGTKDALDVAARENASSQKSIFELTDLVQKIAKYDKSEESREFASRLQAALYAFSARNIPGSKNRGVKSAPFVVLIGANMPSILAEIGFLSNPKEEALLKKPDYRQKLADALCRGVTRYAESLSHFQMALSPAKSDGRP
jgi:N-acetylmuramoyl-L-alanine amidase